MKSLPFTSAAGRHARYGQPSRWAGLLLSCLLFATALTAPAAAADVNFQPGDPGLGDPYYPLDGNGGYDVTRYSLDLSFDPATGALAGSATIRADATQDLSSFNLDLDGLDVNAVTVDGENATHTRSEGELTVTPAAGIRNGTKFEAEIAYSGIPTLLLDQFGPSGFFHTDDGSLVIGQPHVAATWFPANDHPLDKAAFTFRITVPEGREVVANGLLRDHVTADGKATWTWQADEPMATYLATASVGQFELSKYTKDRISYVDAIDPDLFSPVVKAKTGKNFAWSHSGLNSYTRLTRTITVPKTGAALSFWLQRNIENAYDFTFVEARPAGSGDWTTLKDDTGHTSGNPGVACPNLLALHPFLKHYLTDKGDGKCTSTGATGNWWAATGPSTGWESWGVNLSRFAGKKLEVSITYVSDGVLPFDGVFVDDIAVSTGEGSTSFEDDGNKMDGWAASGPPEGSPPSEDRWTAGRDAPPSLGGRAQASFERQPEIIRFLSGYFGGYPFKAAGGIVDDLDQLGFALENQTRPIYSKYFFADQLGADSVVVHELAHQWVGDDLAVETWRDIWLNEGFATYAEWLWSGKEGRETPQQIFDFYARAIPAEAPFWAVTIGDPGPEALFDLAVYARGAMTLHALRTLVGDEVFFDILEEWTESNTGGNVSTADFIKLAERLSGQDLAGFFTMWLYTPSRPGTLSSLDRQAFGQQRGAPGTARMLEERLESGIKPR
ncbi:M1 family aminopeptidase [Arthrobacter sp. NPDC093139]|uniref:M1 family aminopeptidase n=1 Tax=Arthrobacter sp. NPDC093139 TaxID=3363945 RepID=UPI0037FF4F0C